MKDNFYSEYQGSVARLEESVEEDFVNHLKHSCTRERNYRKNLLLKYFEMKLILIFELCFCRRLDAGKGAYLW